VRSAERGALRNLELGLGLGRCGLERARVGGVKRAEREVGRRSMSGVGVLKGAE
jgi:hypothetical protein